MITDIQIKWFFDNMKKRSVIPEISEFLTFRIDDNDVMIRYSVNGRNFSYKTQKESILTFLRDWKLNQII